VYPLACRGHFFVVLFGVEVTGNSFPSIDFIIWWSVPICWLSFRGIHFYLSGCFVSVCCVYYGRRHVCFIGKPFGTNLNPSGPPIVISL
jgi:hypothetical protein